MLLFANNSVDQKIGLMFFKKFHWRVIDLKCVQHPDSVIQIYMYNYMGVYICVYILASRVAQW